MTDQTEAETNAVAEVVADADDVFEIVPVKKGDGYSYIDPVLADIAQKRLALETLAREVKRQLHALDLRHEKRVKAIYALGSLRDYPTEQQRRVIGVFEQAVALRNPAMIEATYRMCVEQDADKTNWKSKQQEPLVTYYSRVMTELTEAQEGNDDAE